MTKPKADKPAPKRSRAGLTDKERQFALHFLGAAKGNATKAAELAGYESKDRTCLRRLAYQIIRRDQVMKEIDRLRERRAERLEITIDDVLRESVEIRDKAKGLPVSVQSLKVLLAANQQVGDHVAVAAFRRQLGLSNPTGGPIEVDLTVLSEEGLEAYGRVARELEGGRPDPDAEASA